MKKITNVTCALMSLYVAARKAGKCRSDYVGDLAYAAKVGTTPKEKLHMLYKLRKQTGQQIASDIMPEIQAYVRAIESM